MGKPDANKSRQLGDFGVVLVVVVGRRRRRVIQRWKGEAKEEGCCWTGRGGSDEDFVESSE